MGALRTLLTAAVLCGSLAVTSGTAFAGREWCDDDPIFVVGTAAFHAYATWGAGARATGIAYVLEVPSNLSARVVIPSTPGGPASVVVSRTLPAWSGGAVSVVLHTTVTAARSTWVHVLANGAGRGSAPGITNHTIDLAVSSRATRGHL